MARYQCPSCGAAYNGRKCRECYYEQFTEEITHGNHVHEGEPLVISAPVRKPIPRKDPFGCEKKTRKRNRKFNPALLIALLAVLNPLLGIVGNLVEEVSSVVTVAPEPEPVLQPENMVIFHQQEDITIFTGMEDFLHPDDGFCLYVEYMGKLPHVTVVAGDIRVNGCDMPFSSVVCKARSGEIGKGWLELDEEDLEINSIEELRTLDFTLTALGSNGRALFTTDEIRIVAEGAA